MIVRFLTVQAPGCQQAELARQTGFEVRHEDVNIWPFVLAGILSGLTLYAIRLLVEGKKP